jgi:phosphohistidine phosphatase SixA
MAKNGHNDDIRALLNVAKEADAAPVDAASVNSNPRIGSYQHQHVHVSEPASCSFSSTKPLWKTILMSWMLFLCVMIAVFLVGMASLQLGYQQSTATSQHPWYQHAQAQREPAALYEYKPATPPPARVFLRPETTTNNHEQHRSLLLLRHAKASRDEDPTTASTAGSGGTAHHVRLDDFDRPLSPEGQLAALQLADYVLHYNVPPPDVIYVSPSIRTLATLALVRSQGWAMKNVPMILDQRLYDFFENEEHDEEHEFQNKTNNNYNSYLEYLRNLDNDNDDDTSNYRRIMIVGHNPPIGALAQRLLVQDDDSATAIGKFSPGSLCDIYWDQHLEHWAQVEDGTGKLGLFVRPRKSG